MKKITFLIGLNFLFFHLSAQVDPIEKQIENSLETLEPEGDENSLIQLADDLEDLQSKRIKINLANQRDLEQIPQLDIFQIHNLLEYRRKTGYILSPYELMAVKGFDQKKIEEILPFLDFSLKPEKFNFPNKNTIAFSKNNLIIRDQFTLEKRRGFQLDSGGYLGSPHSLMSRYKFNFRGKMGAALHLQQDAGEAFIDKNNRPRMDFASFNLFLKDYKFLNSLVIGDFNFEFGQGLQSWSGIGFGKSPNVSQTQRFSRGIIPYSGGEENRFFRGLAIDFDLGNFDVSTFYSKRKLDANLEEENGQFSISSLQSSGWHRTENEIEDKNAVELKLWNTSILFGGSNFSLGLNQSFYSFDHPFKEKERLYQKFDIQSKNWSSSSFSSKYQLKNISLFGEFASHDFNSFAGLIGMQIKAEEALKISILHRNFAKEYQSLYSAPFAEKGSSGEKGYYFGLDWEFNSTIHWKSYFDFYQFTWSSFHSDFPSKGQDIFNQLDLNLSDDFSIYFRFRHRNRQENLVGEQALNPSVQITKTNFRIQLNYVLNEKLSLKNRLEISANSQNEKRGFLIYQDCKYRFSKYPLQLIMRYSVFDISDFENRIYSYENDLSQSFSVPANYGNGQRFYILLKWKIKANIGFEIKYSQTVFNDRNEISSGLNTINGNKISQLKMQLKLSL